MNIIREIKKIINIIFPCFCVPFGCGKFTIRLFDYNKDKNVQNYLCQNCSENPYESK